MPAHRFALATGTALHEGVLVIGGEEARHAARVKRIEPGEGVEVLNGEGAVATGRVTGVEKSRDEWRVRVEVERVSRVEPVRPSVVVCAPAPKGDRLAQMIDGLCQAGAAAWHPMRAARSVVEPRAAKIDRLVRVAEEASKQCGRAWTLRIESALDFAGALRLPGTKVIAHAGAGPPSAIAADAIALLIGPEGGWTPQELAAAAAAGAVATSFGPHVMRVETAAVVACGVMLAR